MIQETQWQQSVWAQVLAGGILGGEYTEQTGRKLNPAKVMMDGISSVFHQAIQQTLSTATWTLGAGPAPPSPTPATTLFSALPAPAVASSLAASAGWTGALAAVPFLGLISGVQALLPLQTATVGSATLASFPAATLVGAYPYALTVIAPPAPALAIAILAQFRTGLPEAIDTVERTKFAEKSADAISQLCGSLSATILMTGTNVTGGSPLPVITETMFP